MDFLSARLCGQNLSLLARGSELGLTNVSLHGAIIQLEVNETFLRDLISHVLARMARTDMRHRGKNGEYPAALGVSVATTICAYSTVGGGHDRGTRSLKTCTFRTDRGALLGCLYNRKSLRADATPPTTIQHTWLRVFKSPFPDWFASSCPLPSDRGLVVCEQTAVNLKRIPDGSFNNNRRSRS